MANAFLHPQELLQALTEIALEMQQTRGVEEVLRIAGAGLAGIGFRLLVAQVDGRRYALRYTSQLGAFGDTLDAAGLGVGQWRDLSEAGPIHLVLQAQQATYVPDMAPLARAALAGKVDTAAFPALDAFTRERWGTVLAPLTVQGRSWGAVGYLHAELGPENLDALKLFSLQLGTAIDVAESLERLERRTAELALVHRLTVAGPRADTRALTSQALEAVCRTTQSDAAVLHRRVAETGDYVLVGDAWGYSGPLVDAYRTLPRLDRPLRAPRAFTPEDFGPRGEAVRAEGFQQLAMVPLSIEGESVGQLTLARRGAAPYGPAEHRSAEILGVQMAAFLERARLYDDLKRSYDELARAQAELVRHERLAALGELAAVMAHEVRNPLGVIFNSLTTLKRLLRPTGDAEMLLSIVGEEAERLNRIVSDLLDFVRPYELAKKPIALEPVVAGAVDSALKSIGAQPVQVVTELPDELPPFPVDAQLLRQALVNLLINAAQAMPRGGTVTVRAAVERRGGAPWLVVEVRDEGVGIAAKAAEKIFQPFFTTKATGTGLGLAVVKRIVEAHLGEVAARPNEGAPGSTFVVRLPGAEGREGLVTPPRPSPAAR